MMSPDITTYMDRIKESIEKQKYRQFIEDITCALNLSGNNEEVRMLYVCGLMRFGNFKEALGEINDLLKNFEISEEDRVNLLRKKSVILCGLDDFQSAKCICMRLCKNDVSDVKVIGYCDLARVYLHEYVNSELGDKDLIEEAVNNARKAASLLSEENSKNLCQEVLMNLGIAYWYTEDYSQALRAFKEVYILSEGEDTHVMISIADTYICLGDYELANEHLNKAELLNLSDSYQLGYIHLARATISYLHHQDLAQAREYILLAYDNFVYINACMEVGHCLNLILYLDYIINVESIDFLINKLSSAMMRQSGERNCFTVDNKLKNLLRWANNQYYRCKGSYAWKISTR